VAFKLVQDGIFQEEGISELLQAPGKLKNNFGTRNLSDNISDLRAQVAANNRGRALIEELVCLFPYFLSFIVSGGGVWTLCCSSIHGIYSRYSGTSRSEYVEKVLSVS
jgi:hypothetical protein